MVVVSKLADFLDFGSSPAESIEDLFDSGSLLHGDDSKLVFFVHPYKESLGCIMENSSSRWPVSVQTTCLEESISLFEEEVVIN